MGNRHKRFVRVNNAGFADLTVTNVTYTGSSAYTPFSTSAFTVPKFGFVDLSVYLDVQNVTNSDNAEGYRYSYDYRTREPSAAAGIFPNLGLRGAL